MQYQGKNEDGISENVCSTHPSIVIPFPFTKIEKQTAGAIANSHLVFRPQSQSWPILYLLGFHMIF